LQYRDEREESENVNSKKGRNMSRGQGGARRPATKFAHLQKKIGKQGVQRNLQSQREALRLRPKKGLP